MTLYAPIFISSLALAFTVLSFWWMNWRPGKVRVGNIEFFAAGKATEGNSSDPNVIIVTLPLILFNTGARPVVIESLRLVSKNGGNLGTLLLEGVDSELTSMPNRKIERNYFFLPTYLKPNEVVKANFVFQRRSSEFQFSKNIYPLLLEGKISGDCCWRTLSSFEIDFSESDGMELFNLNALYCVLPYRRRPHA